jgi:OPA family sugar phosphate sensor protein UhpC-like MFS transporter
MNFKKAFDWLKPAPHLAEIEDTALVQKKYKYWRIRTFYSIYIGYVFYYFTRKSFNFVTPYMSKDLNLTKESIGILFSVFAISYGISKFTSGILCDRSNPRYFMAVGLMLTGVCNLFFGFSASFFLLAFFFALNGWFQGWGWPACTKQLTHWFSRTERGTWWSACSTSHTLGGFLIAYLAGVCAEWYGWRWGMYIPGMISIVVGLWLLNRLRDVPQSLGLPCIEKFKNEEEICDTKETTDEILSVKRILLEQVLNNKFVWALAISYFFVYVVRSGIDSWGNIYLVEEKGFSALAAAGSLAWFEVGGFFGILVAGWGSDHWFQGRRIPFIVICSLGLICTLFGLWYLVPGQFFTASVLITIIGFLVFGPQMLVGLAAAEFVDKKAASTSNGFAGCFAALGTTAAGYPLGKIIEVWGWYGFVITLFICAAMAVIILMPIWSAKKEGIIQSKKVVLPTGVETQFSDQLNSV